MRGPGTATRERPRSQQLEKPALSSEDLAQPKRTNKADIKKLQCITHSVLAGMLEAGAILLPHLLREKRRP